MQLSLTGRLCWQAGVSKMEGSPIRWHKWHNVTLFGGRRGSEPRLRLWNCPGALVLLLACRWFPLGYCAFFQRLCRFQTHLQLCLLEIRRLKGERARLGETERTIAVHVFLEVGTTGHFARRRKACLLGGDFLNSFHVLAGARQQGTKINLHIRFRTAALTLELLCLTRTEGIPPRAPKTGRIGPALSVCELAGPRTPCDEDGAFQHLERK